MTLFGENPAMCIIYAGPCMIIGLYRLLTADEEPPLSPARIRRTPTPSRSSSFDGQRANSGPASLTQNSGDFEGDELNGGKEKADGTGREVALQLKVSHLPALTVYRAHMLLMTFLAILAVDFPVFPRALAKCETFGVSLVCLSSDRHTAE